MGFIPRATSIRTCLPGPWLHSGAGFSRYGDWRTGPVDRRSGGGSRQPPRRVSPASRVADGPGTSSRFGPASSRFGPASSRFEPDRCQRHRIQPGELGRGAIESRPQPGLARSPGLSRTRPPVSGMDWSGFTGTRSADGSAPVSAFPAARFSEIIALFPRGEIGP